MKYSINDKWVDAIPKLVALGIQPKYNLDMHESDGVGLVQRIKFLMVQERKGQGNKRIVKVQF